MNYIGSRAVSIAVFQKDRQSIGRAASSDKRCETSKTRLTVEWLPDPLLSRPEKHLPLQQQQQHQQQQPCLYAAIVVAYITVLNVVADHNNCLIILLSYNHLRIL